MIIKTSALHDLTNELQAELENNLDLADTWNSLTDIQRNEWICWTTLAKQQATRDKRLKRARKDLQEGKKYHVAGLVAHIAAPMRPNGLSNNR